MLTLYKKTPKWSWNSRKLKQTSKIFIVQSSIYFLIIFYKAFYYYSVDQFITHDESVWRKIDIDSNSLNMATYLTDIGKLQDLIRKIHFRCLFQNLINLVRLSRKRNSFYMNENILVNIRWVLRGTENRNI